MEKGNQEGTIISLRLSEDEAKKIDEFCQKEGISRSYFFRKLAKDFFSKTNSFDSKEQPSDFIKPLKEQLKQEQTDLAEAISILEQIRTLKIKKESCLEELGILSRGK